MPLPADTLSRAQKYDPASVERVIGFYLPLVRRIATALAGEDAADDVVMRAVARALPAMSRWRDDGDSDRWFYHFTVLETRRHEATAPAPDPLLNGRSDPAFAAFVRALRSLPAQQREAIVLHHGERLNPRYLAVAMDCSGEAATNHLRAAMVELRSLAGGPLDPLLESFAAAYRQIAPPTGDPRPLIRRRLKRYLFPRRLRRALVLLCVAGVAYVAWRFLGNRY